MKPEVITGFKMPSKSFMFNPLDDTFLIDMVRSTSKQHASDFDEVVKLALAQNNIELSFPAELYKRGRVMVDGTLSTLYVDEKAILIFSELETGFDFDKFSATITRKYKILIDGKRNSKVQNQVQA